MRERARNNLREETSFFVDQKTRRLFKREKNKGRDTNKELEHVDLPNFYNFFLYSDAVMQAGINMYPGETWCNPVIPHAKWHVETSIALTDFVFLSDELYRIL